MFILTTLISARISIAVQQESYNCCVFALQSRTERCYFKKLSDSEADSSCFPPPILEFVTWVAVLIVEVHNVVSAYTPLASSGSYTLSAVHDYLKKVISSLNFCLVCMLHSVGTSQSRAAVRS